MKKNIKSYADGDSAKLTPKADICLILEGSYPYIRGGVSSWVHQLIEGHPDYKFSIIFLGADRKNYGAIHYKLPSNVCHFESHYLNEDLTLGKPAHCHIDKRFISALNKLYETVGSSGQVPEIEDLSDIVRILLNKASHNLDDLFYSEEIWNLLIDIYNKNCSDQAFNEYFWTIRAMYSPLLFLMDLSKRIPDAYCYHTISTGYAGALGMMLKVQKNRPLILSEHGIYTKERQIDLYQAEWIREATREYYTGLDDRTSALRQLWIHFFELLGRLTYSACSYTITLYEKNRQKQIELGANPAKAIVIHNGVKQAGLAKLRSKRSKKIPPVLCLLGRVVPIKDIKTYIYAIDELCKIYPEAEGWIVGPEDEDEEYAEECHELVAQLKLEDKVKFLGFQKIEDILPKIGLIVLSSISEAQPLVILEGFAAGVPAISTDVGFSRGMIEGKNTQDQALGKAGAVVHIASPKELAIAAASLLKDEKRWYAAQKAGIQRVENLYRESTFLNHYKKLYQKVITDGRNRV